MKKTQVCSWLAFCRKTKKKVEISKLFLENSTKSNFHEFHLSTEFVYIRPQYTNQQYMYITELHVFVHLFVFLFIWIITDYFLKLFCSATVPLSDTIVLSWARQVRLMSIDASKWYWDVNSLYRKMTFPKCSAPVCSCIKFSPKAHFCRFFEPISV
jgi:hypothetical protein